MLQKLLDQFFVILAMRISVESFYYQKKYYSSSKQQVIIKRICNIFKNTYFQNRIELLWRNVPVSLEQAFQILIKDYESLLKYRIYKKIVAKGYITIRNEFYKCKLEEPPLKKLKLDEESNESYDKDALNEKKTKIFQFLKELQLNGPKSSNKEVIKEPDYKLITPDKSKHEKNNYDLFIS